MRQIISLDHAWKFQSPATGVWEEVLLPHCAYLEKECASAVAWEGCATYSLELFAPESWKEKIVDLEIGGAMQQCRIFINGIYSFTHFGGYQKFFIPLTNQLNLGEINTVVLELDNRPSNDMPPGKPFSGLDFCYYSGLYRNTALHVCDLIGFSDELKVHIPGGGGVFVRTLSATADRAELLIKAHVLREFLQEELYLLNKMQNCRKMVQVCARLYSPSGLLLGEVWSDQVGILPNYDSTFEMTLPVENPPLWSVKHPNLCTMEVLLYTEEGELLDQKSLRYGIRHISFVPEGFYLNGEKLQIRGSNRHMEYPFVGNAVPANAQYRDAELMKKGGLNFVRLCHYNQMEAFLDACDELGLLVMAPIPGWQYCNMNESFINHAYRDCRELVRTCRNHPSVVLWEASLNETYPASWLNRELHRIVHEEYPGDQCFTCGDSFGLFEEYDVLFFHDNLKNPTKPVFIREYGDWAFGGNNSTSRQRRGAGSEKLLQQSWNFQWTLNSAKHLKNIVGTADWVFIDYNRGYHQDLERSGSLDIYRLPKYKYYFYQSLGDGEPMIFAAKSGEKVVVFSNCDFVRLEATDGRILAEKSPDNGPDTPYTVGGSPAWETASLANVDGSGGNPYDGGNANNLPHAPFTFTGVKEESFTAVGLKNNEIVVRYSVLPAGKPARLALRLRCGSKPVSGNDLVFADALLLDQNGNICESFHGGRVAFDLAGPGMIVGSMEKFESGIAAVLIRITDIGTLELTVKSETFAPQKMSFVAG